MKSVRVHATPNVSPSTCPGPRKAAPPKTPRFKTHEALAKHRAKEAAAYEEAQRRGSPEPGVLPRSFTIPDEWGPATDRWFFTTERYGLDAEGFRWLSPAGVVVREIKRLRARVHGFD